MNDSEQKSQLITADDLESFMEEYVGKLEERVAVETRNFQVMADAMPQIVWTAQGDGTADYYNKRWYEYSGFTEKETFAFSGWKGMKQIMPPEDRKVVKKRWQESLKNGTQFEAEFRLRHRNGKYRWFLCRAMPGFNSKGKVIKWFGTSTDIDDHKRAQERKDEFIAIASHELKTPVTSIKIFTQMMGKHMESKGDTEFIDKIGKMNNQIDKLTVLINDLLDVSKIDTGRLELRQKPVSVDEFVKEVVKDQQLVNDSHKIEIKGQSKAKVLIDKERVEQVLINFISNGVKYSPDSNQLIVHLSSDSKNATVGVQDFGIGIAEGEREQVFDRFFRVSGTQQETFPGMGLGLYIASEIVNRQGGEIWVDSKVGQGSTFYFSLPLYKPKRNNKKGDK